jgi:carbon starvation protein
VLAGAVQDFVILVASARRDGCSLGERPIHSPWGTFTIAGGISTIWPMFGVANQLLAALGLSVGTTILLKLGKARYTPITVVPMAFMFVTTLTASYQLMGRFWRDAAHKPAMALAYRLDAVLVAVMACLAIVALLDSLMKWRRHVAAGLAAAVESGPAS